MPRSTANQLHPEFLSTQNLNSFSGNDSASRKQMMAGNMPQVLSLITPTRRILMTGTEPEYAKYVFKVEMPVDAYIIDIIDRVTSSNVKGALKKNPERLVIYESIDTGEIGILRIPKYMSFHKRFGFEQIPVPENMALLDNALTSRSPTVIRAGTVFARPATVTPEGEYMFGREARCAWVTLPAVIEDGAIISESFARSLSSWIYEDRTVSYGRDWYPLNLHGDDEVYRAHLDVGEVVGDDGILMALRRKRPLLGAVEMTPERLRKVDRIFDKLIKVPPGSEVVNVIVQHDAEARVNNTPMGMEYSPQRYDDAQRRYYNKIIARYRELEDTRKTDLTMTRDFHRLIVEALVYVNPYHKGGRKLCYRKLDLDDWRVTITIRKRICAGMGIKLTDMHGGKGVVCKVTRDEDMPRDKHGKILDLVMDPMSLTKRMNNGRIIEPRISSTCIEYTRLLREELGLHDEEIQWGVSGRAVATLSEERCAALFKQYMGFYELISPWMHQGIKECEDFDVRGHLQTIVSHTMQLWLPTDNPVVYSDLHPRLKAEHPANYSQLTFKVGHGENAKWETTVKSCMVGSIYTVMLEKIARDMSAVASARLQINGVPSRIANADRYSSHVRQQPMRIAGETEVRLMLMAIGGMATRDLLEQTNNPDSHAIIIENIILDERPTDMESVIDRELFPANGHRIRKQIEHLHMCAGIGLRLEPDFIPNE
jgi:hypothetical protein